MSALDRILQSFRDAAVTEREKGSYFERLTVAYLKNDPVQTQFYSDVWHYSDWARSNGWDPTDTGIDLIAKLADEDGYAAIQCKFYRQHHHIQKGDIDKFLASSGKEPIARRVFVDTTDVDWSDNAEQTIRNQTIPVIRIGLQALRESAIDWGMFEATGEVKLQPKKQLLKHQREALIEVEKGFAEHERGKLLMACGTGKTYTALKIAEKIAGAGKRVLFLVPSLALISQTVREWTNDTETELRSFAVCSDAHVGKRRADANDVAEIEIHDLEFPATTNAFRLAQKATVDDAERMTVVFATYQSIPVITAAQQKGLPNFDLVISDEAHRTTGVKFDGEEDSNFIRVHDNAHVAASKRLYMTATPRIYGEGARTKAADAAVELCDMDDEHIYGPTFYARGFGWAVENGLLSDYKVVVLAMDEVVVARSIQGRLAQDNELKIDDATKIIGCYKALLKKGEADEFSIDPQPIKRAIAFCKDIASSKMVAREFSQVVEEFNAASGTDAADQLAIHADHVDGTFNAKTRGELLHWLADDVEDNECKILSNARCLSEGVDVPALDAILFLHPRKSQIDVVQSVGRVMRKAAGKKLGYVILPVVIPAGVSPEQALDDNERYRVVWQILNALRAHDDRFDATINKLELTNDTAGQIEVIAVTDNLPAQRPQPKGMDIGGGAAPGDDQTGTIDHRPTNQLNFIFDEFPAAIRAKIVQKCGRRTYWEDWAKDIASIAQKHILRIKTILESGEHERAKFDEFLTEIRDDLNGSVTEEEAIEMLAQHLITKPVFNALFEHYDFASLNPVSLAMQEVIAVLEPQNISKEAEDLEGFYASVRKRAEGIDNAEGKQKIIVELYEKFFKTAFPNLTEKLGIVYTPVEVVDFIIHSVNDILKQEFGQTLGSRGVHILDPFTGTGTFITRLLQSGLIANDELEFKYKNEIHANEIVLLAYYIAAVNIEAAYHSVHGSNYEPFDGICLTDTFEMYESDDMVASLMADNSERRNRQKALDIRVIIGNPPYNVSNTGVVYKGLNTRIAETYAASTKATNKNSLYDSYIQAMRWASDRIGDSGIVGFVTNGGWLDGNAMNGMRKCLREEFSSVYVFNLRGNQRTSGELSKREGGKIFGQGSRAPVAISFLVKNPSASDVGKIFYHDIGDYLSREQKLDKVVGYASVAAMDASGKWSVIEPDEHNDWLTQRDTKFDRYIQIGSKEDKSAVTIFETYSRGIETGRDAWVINSSKVKLEDNVRGTISFYESERERLRETFAAGKFNDRSARKFIGNDVRRISWTSSLITNLIRDKEIEFHRNHIVSCVEKPFTKQCLYFDEDLNHRRGQLDKFFASANVQNRVVWVTGVGASVPFSCYISDCIPSREGPSSAQCFPLKIYSLTTDEDAQAALFATERLAGFSVSDGLTDAGLRYFQAAYHNAKVSKEDVFYYVYGLLHSEDYRTRFADNLSKELPRIPAVNKEADFWAFVEAGRKLGELHVNYETVDPYPVTYAEGDLNLAVIDDPVRFYRVEQMKFAGKRPNLDKTTVHYNPNITMTNIPLEAYDYVVNGKSALDWVMERQRVKTDSVSGIVNDANDYANETMNDPAYPLKLFQRVITVSLQTMEIVRSLPALDID